MNSVEIVVRQAVREDAPLIARAVAMAIGDEEALRSYCGEDYLGVLTLIAEGDDTQYSWRNGLVAEVDGVVVGAIVGYDGAQLRTLRDGTFAILQEAPGRVPTIADETEAGEYYLDSVGVMPEFCGQGVGRALIEALCERGLSEGHEYAGLIVDCDNPRAEKLYTSLGFERVGTRIFFGHQMWHLQRRLL